MRRFWLAAVVAFSAIVASPAFATVTTSDSLDTFSPASPTSTFTIDFPFVSLDHLTVTLITEATLAEQVLTRGTHYTAKLPVGAVKGSITMVNPASVTSTHTLEVERVVPVTQATSFKTQGSYSAALHEAALDKLTMIAQQIVASEGEDGQSAVDTHVGLSDPHTQYALLAGRAGGQTLIGGTGSGENLFLRPTSHATKGKIYIGSGNTELVIDDTTNYVGIGTPNPTVMLDVIGAAEFFSTMDITGDLTLRGGVSALTFTDSATSVVLPDNDATAMDIGASGKTSMMRFDTTNNFEQLLLSVDTQIQDGTYSLQLGDDYINFASDSTTAEYGITSTDAAGNTAGGSGLVLGGPDDTDNGGRLLLYGASLLFAGDIAGTGDIDAMFNGALTGAMYGQTESAIAETLTGPADCRSVIYASIDNTVVSLPELPDAGVDGTTADGCEILIVNDGADGAVLLNISPTATDGIVGSCVGVTGAGSATVVQFSGTVAKDAINAKATANKGDYIRLLGTTHGSATAGEWHVVGCGGEWASEP